MTANEGHQGPTTATHASEKLMQVHEGQHGPMKTNEDQRGPTTASRIGPNDARHRLGPGMFLFFLNLFLYC